MNLLWAAPATAGAPGQIVLGWRRARSARSGRQALPGRVAGGHPGRGAHGAAGDVEDQGVGVDGDTRGTAEDLAVVRRPHPGGATDGLHGSGRGDLDPG